MTAESGGRKLTVGILGGMGPEATVDLQRRVIELHPPVVAAAQQRPVDCEQRGTDRDAALRQPFPGLLDRDVEHLGVRGHSVCTASFLRHSTM